MLTDVNTQTIYIPEMETSFQRKTTNGTFFAIRAHVTEAKFDHLKPSQWEKRAKSREILTKE